MYKHVKESCLQTKEGQRRSEFYLVRLGNSGTPSMSSVWPCDHWEDYRYCALLQPCTDHSLSGRHISAYELCVCLRMTTFCHSLSYADARRQHVGRWLSERSEHDVIRARTSELVAYAEKFYACTKILCVCRRTARTQRARYAHAMRTFRASAARWAYADVGGHKICQFHDEPSACWQRTFCQRIVCVFSAYA